MRKDEFPIHSEFIESFNSGRPLGDLMERDAVALEIGLKLFDDLGSAGVRWNSRSGFNSARAFADALGHLHATGDLAMRRALVGTLATALENARGATGVRLSLGEPEPARMSWAEYANLMAQNFERPLVREMLTLGMMSADDYARAFLAKDGGLERAESLLKAFVDLGVVARKDEDADPERARVYADVRRAEEQLRAAIHAHILNPPPPAAEAPPAPPQQINLAPTFKIESPVVHVAPAEVHVEAIMPTQQEVVITAMPSRKTTTEISRDSRGQIVESTQVEADVP